MTSNHEARHVTDAAGTPDEIRLRRLLDQLTFGILIHRRYVPLYVNRAWAELHGLTVEQVMSMNHVAALVDPARHTVQGNHSPSNVERLSGRYRYRVIRSDGTATWLEASVSSIEWDGASAIQMMTSRLHPPLAHERHSLPDRSGHLPMERFVNAIEALPDGYALYDRDERLVTCNRRYLSTFPHGGRDVTPGTTFESHLLLRLAHGMVPDAKGREDEWMAERIGRFRSHNQSFDAQTKDGRWLFVRHSCTADGGVLLIISDITHRKRTEQALSASEARFKDFAGLAADSFWETDENLRYTFLSEWNRLLVNGPLTAAHGKTPDELFGARLAGSAAWRQHWAAMQAHQPSEVEYELEATDGTLRVLRCHAKPIHDACGRFLGYRGVGRDITQAYQLSRRLAHQASHDKLTGLANRDSFERMLESAVRYCRSTGSVAALCFIDLDQFKVVNDSIGHMAGDMLLKQVAELLANAVRPDDLLARLGGDEFGLLLKDCTLEQAKSFAEELIQTLAEFRFFWQGRMFEVSASVGVVAVSPRGLPMGDLMAQADIACYAAKDLGRNRVHVYHEADIDLRRRHEELLRAASIRDALNQKRFSLFIQPIATLARPHAGQIRHFEILLRLLDSDGSKVSPGAFIPAAERYGLMGIIDRWVIQTVLSELRPVLDAQPELQISINLSGNTLNDESLYEFIKEQLGRSRVDAQCLCFEITETALISNLHQASQFIQKTRLLGCRFALDDFGSGLSSFAYLKHFPVDYLKIDGSFVRDIATDRTDHAMVAAINQVGHVLGIKTIGEFAETEQVLTSLREIGVDFAQGYAIGRPQPLTANTFSTGCADAGDRLPVSVLRCSQQGALSRSTRRGTGPEPDDCPSTATGPLKGGR